MGCRHQEDETTAVKYMRKEAEAATEDLLFHIISEHRNQEEEAAIQHLCLLRT